MLTLLHTNHLDRENVKYSVELTGSTRGFHRVGSKTARGIAYSSVEGVGGEGRGDTQDQGCSTGLVTAGLAARVFGTGGQTTGSPKKALPCLAKTTA